MWHESSESAVDIFQRESKPSSDTSAPETSMSNKQAEAAMQALKLAQENPDAVQKVT